MNELRKLPDSKVFARDPETWDNESLPDAVERLAKIAERLKRVAALDNAVVPPHIKSETDGGLK